MIEIRQHMRALADDRQDYSTVVFRHDDTEARFFAEPIPAGFMPGLIYGVIDDRLVTLPELDQALATYGLSRHWIVFQLRDRGVESRGR